MRRKNARPDLTTAAAAEARSRLTENQVPEASLSAGRNIVKPACC